METGIIELRDLSLSYGSKKVIDNLNLCVRKGEFVTLLGPSGCGKTTILRLIAGFLKPQEGSVLLDGKDISDLPPYQRPLNTVFQRYALFPHLDVYDNIAFGLKLQGMPEDEIDKRVRKVLKMVTLTDYEDRDIDSLSGGQQQRVAIARALVNQPKVLLLDEPLSALDHKMRQDMQIELKEMHRKLGITFIYVTHDQEEALTLSDTIVVMNEGKIQQIGTPADIYNEPVNAFVANFIGESNILDGTMIRDRRVEFIGQEFDCVDEGFAANEPVDVVIRPEDIYIMNQLEGSQFSGVVKSCTFKGVHYEMYVDTPNGYEIQIQDYNAFEVGSTVGLLVKAQDIQVMHKKRLANVFEAEVLDSEHIGIYDGEFECRPLGDIEAGSIVRAEIAFDKVELMDNIDDGELQGEVRDIYYKGNHYHLKIHVHRGQYIYVDSQDVWDRGDLVGVKILPENINIISGGEN